MANYRTTVILKTDVVDSTPRLAEQTQAEMGLQRKQHKQFIAEVAAKHHGSVFDEEGDAYWIDFPSVTNAVFAAMEMHQNLRIMQAGKREKQRLAIRAVITVGDILHQEKDTIGMAMNLTARIEKVTPPDEIYLSHAAWLILNKAEVQTEYVNEFDFKGFSEPEGIYRVIQKHGIRVLTDQCIIFADAQGFTDFSKSTSMEQVENFLLEYDRLMNDVCAEYDGVIRSVNGDMYFLTFARVDQAISAIQTLCLNWKRILDRHNVGIIVGIHKGDLNVFRSYVFGEDINVTMYLSELTRFYRSGNDNIFVMASERIKDEANAEGSDVQFQELDPKELHEEPYKAALRELRAYRLMVSKTKPVVL